MRALEREVAGLEPIYREVVVLRHVEGLAYEEMAEVLAVSLGTVKSRLARGRDQLRKALGPMLDEYFEKTDTVASDLDEVDANSERKGSVNSK